MKSCILVLTNEMDPHSDHMIRYLSRRRGIVARLNTDDLPQHAAMAFELTDDHWGGHIELVRGHRRISIADVTAVWYRRPSEYTFGVGTPHYVRAFVRAELSHTLSSIWASTHCYWNNRPDRIREASWRLEQLQRARALGLDVPRTLVTTIPGAMREFIDECGGRVATKLLDAPTAMAAMQSAGDLPDEPLAFPTRIVDKAAVAQLSGAELAPCLLQEYVEKAVELRVTVVEDEVFTAEIHSQECEQSRVDYRHYPKGMRLCPGSLPEAVAAACVELVRSYGLSYSALDLVLTPDGRYIFLDSNPVGQYLFVEHSLPELRITDAIARHLLAGERVGE